MEQIISAVALWQKPDSWSFWNKTYIVDSHYSPVCPQLSLTTLSTKNRGHVGSWVKCCTDPNDNKFCPLENIGHVKISWEKAVLCFNLSAQCRLSILSWVLLWNGYARIKSVALKHANTKFTLIVQNPSFILFDRLWNTSVSFEKNSPRVLCL